MIATFYARLGLDASATDEDVRRAWRKMQQLFSQNSLALYGLYRAQDIDAELARLREAYEVLVDTVARRRYNRRIQHSEAPQAKPAPRQRPAVRTQFTAPPPKAAPPRRTKPPADPLANIHLGAEELLDGFVLTRVRETCGIALEEIAERTKISIFTLRCIETHQYKDLPPKVYLRGFLKQVALHLNLPPDRLVREYLEVMQALS